LFFVLLTIVLALIFAPRYALSTILWLAEGKGVNASVKRSYDLTRGNYWKVLFSLIGILIVIGICMIPLRMLGALGGELGSSIVGSFGQQAAHAVSSAFLLQLTGMLVKGNLGKKA
jgi:hypothetical protein